VTVQVARPFARAVTALNFGRWHSNFGRPLKTPTPRASLPDMIRRIPLALLAAVAIVAAVAAPAAAAGSSTAELHQLLVKPGDMPGLRPAGSPYTSKNPGTWLGHVGYKGKEREEVEARFVREKWVAGIEQRLSSSKGTKAEGIETLYQFKTAAGARAEMKAQLKEDTAPQELGKDESVKFFKIPGLSGAKAFEFIQKGKVWAANVLFVRGSTLALLGNFEPAGESQAVLTAGIEAILARVSS
jgi:hypothetical protein